MSNQDDLTSPNISPTSRVMAEAVTGTLGGSAA